MCGCTNKFDYIKDQVRVKSILKVHEHTNIYNEKQLMWPYVCYLSIFLYCLRPRGHFRQVTVRRAVKKGKDKNDDREVYTRR